MIHAASSLAPEPPQLASEASLEIKEWNGYQTWLQNIADGKFVDETGKSYAIQEERNIDLIERSDVQQWLHGILLPANRIKYPADRDEKGNFQYKKVTDFEVNQINEAISFEQQEEYKALDKPLPTGMVIPQTSVEDREDKIDENTQLLRSKLSVKAKIALQNEIDDETTYPPGEENASVSTPALMARYLRIAMERRKNTIEILKRIKKNVLLEDIKQEEDEKKDMGEMSASPSEVQDLYNSIQGEAEAKNIEEGIQKINREIKRLQYVHTRAHILCTLRRKIAKEIKAGITLEQLGQAPTFSHQIQEDRYKIRLALLTGRLRLTDITPRTRRLKQFFSFKWGSMFGKTLTDAEALEIANAVRDNGQGGPDTRATAIDESKVRPTWPILRKTIGWLLAIFKVLSSTALSIVFTSGLCAAYDWIPVWSCIFAVVCNGLLATLLTRGDKLISGMFSKPKTQRIESRHPLKDKNWAHGFKKGFGFICILAACLAAGATTFFSLFSLQYEEVAGGHLSFLVTWGEGFGASWLSLYVVPGIVATGSIASFYFFQAADIIKKTINDYLNIFPNQWKYTWRKGFLNTTLGGLRVAGVILASLVSMAVIGVITYFSVYGGFSGMMRGIGTEAAKNSILPLTIIATAATAISRGFSEVFKAVEFFAKNPKTVLKEAWKNITDTIEKWSGEEGKWKNWKKGGLWFLAIAMVGVILGDLMGYAIAGGIKAAIERIKDWTWLPKEWGITLMVVTPLVLAVTSLTFTWLDTIVKRLKQKKAEEPEAKLTDTEEYHKFQRQPDANVSPALEGARSPVMKARVKGRNKNTLPGSPLREVI